MIKSKGRRGVLWSWLDIFICKYHAQKHFLVQGLIINSFFWIFYGSKGNCCSPIALIRNLSDTDCSLSLILCSLSVVASTQVYLTLLNSSFPDFPSFLSLLWFSFPLPLFCTTVRVVKLVSVFPHPIHVILPPQYCWDVLQKMKFLSYCSSDRNFSIPSQRLEGIYRHEKAVMTWLSTHF